MVGEVTKFSLISVIQKILGFILSIMNSHIAAYVLMV